MKFIFKITLVAFFSISAFAYDPSLYINVEKASAFLERAESDGVTPSGSKCYVELRRIEDGYYTVYTEIGKEYFFIGLDIEAYGKIKSKWTKRSLVLHQRGIEGSQDLIMREEFSMKKLSVYSRDVFHGKTTEVLCYLPLK